MATNTSEYLGLHLWEPNDQVLREEFNENWEKIDGETAEIRTNLTQGLAEARSADYLVKLGGPLVTTEQSGTLTFDLSGVDMSQYGALFLTVYAGCSDGVFSLTVNSTELMSLCGFNFSYGAGIAWLVPMGTNQVAGYSRCTTYASREVSSSSGSGVCSVAWANIKSLTASGSSYAGATLNLYGVKA